MIRSYMAAHWSDGRDAIEGTALFDGLTVVQWTYLTDATGDIAASVDDPSGAMGAGK